MCLAIANFAGDKFFDIYKQFSEEQAYTELSTKEMVDNFNKEQFKGKLKVFTIEKDAGDYYVRGGQLFLSHRTLQSDSLASYTVLAHELGHALQDRDTNKLRRKSILTKIGKFIGPFMFPSFLAGLILFALGGNLLPWGVSLLIFGGCIFALALILKLVTINIEKNASTKAIDILSEILSKNQLKSAKKLLKSAKLTYWAEFFRTLLSWTFLTKQTKLFN